MQLMDMKKHKLGRRELETFARAVGAQGLLDKEDKKVKEHPACYYNQDGMILGRHAGGSLAHAQPRCPQRKQGNGGMTAPRMWEQWIAAEK